MVGKGVSVFKLETQRDPFYGLELRPFEAKPSNEAKGRNIKRCLGFFGMSLISMAKFDSPL